MPRVGFGVTGWDWGPKVGFGVPEWDWGPRVGFGVTRVVLGGVLGSLGLDLWLWEEFWGPHNKICGSGGVLGPPGLDL